MPVVTSVSRMSVRCAPRAHVPAAASRARLAANPARSQSSTAKRGFGFQAFGDRAGQADAGRREGARARLDLGVQPGHQAETSGGGGDGMARNGVLQAGQPGRVLAALRQQAVAAVDGGVVGRHLAGVARLQRPDQAIEEAAAAGQAFLEQPVHLRRQPDGGDQTGDVGLTARGGAIQAEHAAVGVGLGAGADGGLALLRYATERRRPSRRGRLGAAGRHCARRAGRGRAPAATVPPAGWSCRCHSARTAR